MRGKWTSWVGVCLVMGCVIGSAQPAEEVDQAPPPDPVPSAVPRPADPAPPPAPVAAAPTTPFIYEPAPLISGDGIWSVVAPRVGAAYFTGPGMGYANGFTALEGFVPLYGGSPEHLVYLDLRGIISDQSALWSNNVGGGYRYYSAELNRIFGVWNAWDMRNTVFNRYNQISGGVETIGRYVDVRSNFYAIVGPQSTRAADYFICNPFFQGTNILAPHVIGTESALTGADAEIGGPVPGLSRFGVRAYVGGYAYHGDVLGDFGGVQGRFQSRLNNNIDMNLTLRGDPVFGTTVVFGGAIRWGGLRREYREADRQSVFNRYADPVVRNYQVSIGQNVQQGNEVLHDPTTGKPITVIHVNNTAAPGGDGSFERPLNMLAPASALAGINGIILVYHGTGTTFNYDQGITLQNGQRLLGNSMLYPFLSRELGLCTLPNVPDGRPNITNLNGAGVVLASGNEVAGMNIVSPALQGIVGTGVTNFNIHDINITFPGAEGILLSNVAGTGMISNVLVDSTSIGAGLNISTNGANVLAVQVLGSTFSNNNGPGILLTSNDSSVLTALIQGGSKTGNNGPGVLALANGNSQLNVSVLNDPISANLGAGIRVASFNTSRVTADIEGNTITNNSGSGVSLVSHDQSSMTATVRDNTIENNERNGVRVTSRDFSLMSATVDGNTIANNGRAGIRAVSREQSGMGIIVSNNTINGNTDDGIFFHERNNSAMTAVATGNAINSNGIDGIFAQFNGNGQSFTATNNTVFNSADHGIHVEMNGGATQSFTIAGNAINGNGTSSFGIIADVSGPGTITGSISNNASQNNVVGGIAANLQGRTAVSFSAIGNNASDNGAFGMGLRMISRPGGTLNATIAQNTTNNNTFLGLGVLASADNSSTAVKGNHAENNGLGIVFLQVARNNADTSLQAEVSGNTASNNNFLGIAAGEVSTAAVPANPMLLTVAGNSTSSNGAIGLALFNFHGRLNAEVDNNTMNNDNTLNVGFGGGVLAASGAQGRTQMNFRNNNSTPANGFGYDFFKLGPGGFFRVYIPNAGTDSNNGTINSSGGVVFSPTPLF